MKLTSAHGLAMLLVLVGGFNWGLIGFFEYSLVDEVFGAGGGVARTVYALVGLAAVYLTITQMPKADKNA